jgi:hypothetical protein
MTREFESIANGAYAHIVRNDEPIAPLTNRNVDHDKRYVRDGTLFRRYATIRRPIVSLTPP